MTTAEQDELLVKAQEAEILAESAGDAGSRETWRRIAASYRDMARVLEARSGHSGAYSHWGFVT